MDNSVDYPMCPSFRRKIAVFSPHTREIAEIPDVPLRAVLHVRKAKMPDVAVENVWKEENVIHRDMSGGMPCISTEKGINVQVEGAQTEIFVPSPATSFIIVLRSMASAASVRSFFSMTSQDDSAVV